MQRILQIVTSGNIAPLLEAGYIVLSDRYAYTAFARDVVRGCSPRWVRKMYSFAMKPDITFYFQVPIDTAINRIMVGRPKIKYYEGGMDLNLSNDPFESYRIFQSRIIEQYEQMIGHDGFTVIDGTQDIEEQQVQVRDKVMQMLPKQALSKINAVQTKPGAVTSNASTSYPARPLAFYGEGIKYLKDTEIKGRLIVIEGPDGSGRSTQIQTIIAKLESDGHAVVNTGLKDRS